MHLIGIKAYRKGFFGCLEDKNGYVCFLFSRHTFRAITTYAKADFENRRHLMATLHKFVPRHFFLQEPVPMASIDAVTLKAVTEQQARRDSGDAHRSAQAVRGRGCKEGV